MSPIAIVLQILLLASAHTLSGAPKPKRIAAPPAIQVPYTAFTLANGLKVIVHEDHSFPIVSVNTWYHVGSGDEKPGRTGFAHLFEHIMFMGSQHVANGEFDRRLEAAGANNNGSTTQDRTNYYEDGPANALELMFWLDSDRMGYLLPEMTAEKLDLQRGVVQNERRQSYENQPYGLANENILARLYPAEHPYHWSTIGSMADLAAASLDDVKGFFTTYYAPNNATVSVAGDVTVPEARRLAERYFGAIPRVSPAARPTVPEFALPGDTLATLEDRVQLPRVYNAWHSVRAFAKDDAALDALAGILAAGKSSRLYQRLVYQLQIASQVVGYQNGGRLDGMFMVYATARPGHDLNELQVVIDEEIAKLAASGPTVRELDRVKNGAESQALAGLEQVGGFSGKANQLNYYDYFAGTPDYFQKDLDRTRALTPGDIQRVATEYLTAKKRVTLSVVPQGKTELAVQQGGAR